MRSTRRASLFRLALSLTLAASALAIGAPAARASSLTAPRTTGSGARTLHPARGPQLLRTVAPNAFPPHQGFGDARFGVVEAFEVPKAADALHVGWERVQIRWDELQPKGPLQWDSNATGNDKPFAYELAHGRQLVGVLQGIPSWAAVNATDGNAAVPQNIDLPWNDPRNYWGQFVFRAVRHYRGRIDTFAVLNEVNIASGAYHQFDGSVAQYAQMLRVAYLAAHAANPHVEVHIYGDSVYADDGAWFKQTLAALAAFPDARENNLFFDAAEVHLYSSVLRWDTLIAQWRADMQTYGVQKPIWMSETNVSPRDDTDPLCHCVAFPANHNTPLALQPNFLVASFAAALGLGLPRAEVYRMRDPRKIWPEHPNGLLRYDGSPRPEYDAFRTVNQWFAGVTAARYEPCATPFVDKRCLFRVVMERPAQGGQPAQEIQVLWNQGGVPLTASVPDVSASHTATLVQPLGATSTLQATNGRFSLALPGATDRQVKPTVRTADGQIHSLSEITYTNVIKIGTAPQIVVQDLPSGQDVPDLHALFVEPDRGAGVPATTLGPVASVAALPDGSVRALADTAHDRVLLEDAQGHVTASVGGTGGAPGQFRGPAGVALGSDGTLYVADQGNARIQEFDLAGHLLGGFGQYAAGAASLQAPVTIAVAPDGTLYVADAAQDAVLHFDRMGQFLGRWGTPGYGADQLDGPGGLAVDSQGHLWVADTLNNRVVEVAFDAQGHGHTLAQLGTGAQGDSDTMLHWPTAVSVLPGGGVAIADAGNTRVVTVAHPQTDLGSLPLGGLVKPGGLAIAPDGSYFVSDSAMNRIVHVDAQGHQIGAFGSRGFGQGQFFGPLGLTIGPDGNLYVADGGNNRIEVLTQQGHFVRKIGSQGHAPGQFLGPHAVAVAPDGTLWVADTFNARIAHLTPGGGVLGTISGVNGAWGVASDGHDGVYYSAHWGQRLYHWTPRGQQGWGGPGSGAGEFMHPGALASSHDGGTLYAVDEGNQRVQYVSGGRVAGQRGSAATLGAPVAVAVAPDGSIAVLDAAPGHPLLARYAGAQAGGFTASALPGVPLGLAALSGAGSSGSAATGSTGTSGATAAGGSLVVTVDGSWSGLSAEQQLSAGAGSGTTG